MINQNQILNFGNILRLINYYKIHIICLACVIAGLYGIYLYSHNDGIEYQTNASMYVMEKEVEGNVVSGASDHTINDYARLIQSDFILSDVAARLDTTVDDLNSAIEISVDSSSYIINVSVKNENPDFAANIANQIVETSCNKLSTLSDYYDVSVVNKARVPGNPVVKENWSGIAKCFLLALLVINIGIVFIYIFRDSIKDSEMLEKALGTPILASVRKKHILKFDNWDTFFSDIKVKNSMDQILYTIRKTGIKSVLVTSVKPGEGKSFITRSIAARAVEHNKNVAILDMNVRYESSLKKHDKKLIKKDVMHDELDAYFLWYETDVNKTPILKLKNKDLCFEEQRIQKIINLLNDSFDMILIDCGTYEEFMTTALAEFCDAGLIVMDPNKANEKDLVRLKKNITSVGCKLLGIVCNKVL